MDPLSATASVVALITLCTNVGRGTLDLVKTLNKAPVELVLLSNEVNDLSAILNEVRLACLADSRAPKEQSFSDQSSLSNRVTFATQVATQVGHARDEVQSLDAIVKSLKTSPHSGRGIETERLRWAMKKGHSQKIQKQLQQRVQKLLTLLQARST